MKNFWWGDKGWVFDWRIFRLCFTFSVLCLWLPWKHSTGREFRFYPFGITIVTHRRNFFGEATIDPHVEITITVLNFQFSLTTAWPRLDDGL